MTVKVFIIEKGETRELGGLSQSERERVSEALDRQALIALGYAPIESKSLSKED